MESALAECALPMPAQRVAKEKAKAMGAAIHLAGVFGRIAISQSQPPAALECVTDPGISFEAPAVKEIKEEEIVESGIAADTKKAIGSSREAGRTGDIPKAGLEDALRKCSDGPRDWRDIYPEEAGSEGRGRCAWRKAGESRWILGGRRRKKERSGKEA